MPDDLEIVGRLSSSFPEERRTAREHLDSMGGSRALKLLLGGLGNEKWRIRKAAADVLVAWENHRQLAEALMELLGDTSDAARRNAAVEVLTRIGEPVVEYLIPALKNEDPHVRKLIVDVLGAIADTGSERFLTEALFDEDDNVRMAVTEALSNFKSENTVNALLRIVRGPDVPMRFYAMESLAKMDTAIPIDDILPLVDQKILRRAALDALGNCPGEDSLAVLVEALSDTSRSNRYSAIRSLGKLYNLHPLLRSKMAEAVSNAGSEKELLKFFDEALSNSSGEIRSAATKILGMIPIAEAAMILIEAARDSDLQHDAVESLEKIADVSPGALSDAMPPRGDPLRELLENIVEDRKTSVKPAVSAPPSLLKHMHSVTMTDAQFMEFRDLLHDFCGIYFNDDMKFILEKRLVRRLEAIGVGNFSEYMDIIKGVKGKNGELGEAINILTTNETYFFREKFQLKAFKEEILPSIQKEKLRKKDRKLRIWSAGCSSGEEVYTIAILVEESGLFDGWDVKVLGSDISTRVLERAERGVYSSNSFRETSENYMDNYFICSSSDDCRVVDRLKRLVDFRKVNLVNSDEVFSTGAFDLIFCRNVIIYFDIEAKRRVIDYLLAVLNPGGYLLLGHSESLLNISTKFDLVHLKSDMVYRKPVLAGGDLS